MTDYTNPFIGWFLKRKLRRIIGASFIISLVFIIFLRKYVYKKSSGCTRPNCYSAECTGYKCIASGCIGLNCKGADCYGEKCEAGDCKGVGCRAGDCYGLNCTPGECVDPTCDGKRRLNKECTPFCFNGRAYNLPKNFAYPYIRVLPKNTIFNPNFCDNNKRTGIFTNEKKIYNFTVDQVNLYTSGYKPLEEVKYKDSLQSGKTYILGNDIDFKSSIPNVYKNDKCEWSTKFKETEISASFNPYYNQKKDEYTWVADNFLAFPLDDEGKVTPCPKGSHEMVPHYFISTRRQISSIIFKNSKQHIKNFEIDSIKGDKMINICKNCGQKSIQYLNVSEHPIMNINSIKPCKIRAYRAKPIKDDTNQISKHEIIDFNLLRKESSELYDYLSKYQNNPKTYMEHHLFLYTGTDKNTQKYRCYWCNNTVNVNYKSLPRKFNDNSGEFNGDLDKCIGNNDYNHYMYDLLDNNKTIYQKCLKCNKESYPHLQKLITNPYLKI